MSDEKDARKRRRAERDRLVERINSQVRSSSRDEIEERERAETKRWLQQQRDTYKYHSGI